MFLSGGLELTTTQSSLLPRDEWAEPEINAYKNTRMITQQDTQKGKIINWWTHMGRSRKKDENIGGSEQTGGLKQWWMHIKETT